MAKRNRSRQALRRRQVTFRGVLLIVGVALGGFLAFSFFFDDMGLRKYLSMQQHAHQLEQEIRDLKKTNADLRIELDRVQHSPARIEELARERLGYVRKGETVYQIIEDSKSR